jgi:hypothetical protein
MAIDLSHGDLLLLATGRYEGSMFPVLISKSVTIEGDARGVWLSGSNRTRILNVVEASVTLSQLSLTNGVSHSGGAMYVTTLS